MSSRSFLDILPLELVHKILDEFCHHIKPPLICRTCVLIECGCADPVHPSRRPPIAAWTRTLARLSRTSRTLNHLTTPRLYCHPTAAPGIALTLLARTLVTRPDLARLVRILDVSRSSSQGPPCEEVIDYVVDKAIVHARTRDLEPVQARAYYRQRFHSELQSSPTIDILSSLCPNLEALAGSNTMSDVLHRHDQFSPMPYPTRANADRPRIWPPTFPGEGFWIPGGVATDLSKLKVLNLSHADTEGGFGLEEFQGLLGSAASSLEALRLHMLAGCSITRVPIALGRRRNICTNTTERLEKVKRLFLDYSMITSDDLANPVELCPNVEYFAYECASSYVVSQENDQFGPRDAVDAVLGRYRYRDRGNDESGETDRPSRPGSMPGWKSLKEIKLILWADEMRNGWSVDELPDAERVFAERGIKFTYEV